MTPVQDRDIEDTRQPEEYPEFDEDKAWEEINDNLSKENSEFLEGLFADKDSQIKTLQLRLREYMKEPRWDERKISADTQVGVTYGCSGLESIAQAVIAQTYATMYVGDMIGKLIEKIKV